MDEKPRSFGDDLEEGEATQSRDAAMFGQNHLDGGSQHITARQQDVKCEPKDGRGTVEDQKPRSFGDDLEEEDVKESGDEVMFGQNYPDGGPDHITARCQGVKCEPEDDSAGEQGEPPKKPFICVCGKGYTIKSHLYRHLKSHMMETSIEKAYREADQGKHSKKRVTREKTFICDCGKGYTSSSHLYRHQRVCARMIAVSNVDSGVPRVRGPGRKMSETKIKSYACVCGKSYTSSSHLYRHQKTHLLGDLLPKKESAVETGSGEGPAFENPSGRAGNRYICDCGRSYASLSHLCRHQKTHKGSKVTTGEESENGSVGETETEKPARNIKSFVCACGRSYTSSSHLYRHQRTHLEHLTSKGGLC